MPTDASNSAAEAGSGYPKWLTIVIALLPALTLLGLTIWLIFTARLTFISFADPQTLSSIAMVVLFVVAGLVSGWGVRMLLPADRRSQAEDGGRRSRVRASEQSAPDSGPEYPHWLV